MFKIKMKVMNGICKNTGELRVLFLATAVLIQL